MPLARHRRAPRPGSVLVFVVVLLVVLVGMVAFAIDTGQVAHARTNLQAAADAGVLAGLSQLPGTVDNPDYTAARAEVRKYIGGSAGNIPGLVVPDRDIQFGVYDPSKPAGARFSTTLNGVPANAVRVTLRRDGATNPQLALSFGAILGRSSGTVLATATAYGGSGQLANGLKAGSPLIPYVVHVDYFNAAAGLPARPSSSTGFINVNPATLSDAWKVGSAGSAPAPGSDGVKEFLLFDSSGTAPGNFGSVDLGSASNGTPDLIRQLQFGPNANDFALMKSAGKLAADGTLRAPLTLGGDPGISNGTASTWESLVGRNRIIPLYATVSGNGNNAQYQVVGFAAVRIVRVSLTGNPKQIWAQYTTFSTPAAVSSGTAPKMPGVTLNSPKLVIP